MAHYSLRHDYDTKFQSKKAPLQIYEEVLDL